MSLRSAVLCGVLLAGCGTPTATPDAGPLNPTYIALARDFDGFEQWERFDLGPQPAGSVHSAGPRSVFLRARPPKGASAFPVGTLLVKVLHTDGGTPGEIFAMAKRGGGYNAEAAGWEWFQLEPEAQPRIMIWRGEQPPAKAGYAGGPAGACNECHVEGGNDHVLTPTLKLGGL